MENARAGGVIVDRLIGLDRAAASRGVVVNLVAVRATTLTALRADIMDFETSRAFEVYWRSISTTSMESGSQWSRRL